MTMKLRQMAVMLSALAIALTSNAALGQDTSSQKAVAARAKPGIGKGIPTSPHPDKPGHRDYAGKVLKLQQEMEAAKTKFLDDQNNLQLKLREAKAAQRDLIRAEIRDKREAFLEQQREQREELKQRIAELRDSLPSHGDVIDAAKEQAKDKVHRKGGGD
jgi:Skp family chaperone for outer membrane proteins